MENEEQSKHPLKLLRQIARMPELAARTKSLENWITRYVVRFGNSAIVSKQALVDTKCAIDTKAYEEERITTQTAVAAAKEYGQLEWESSGLGEALRFELIVISLKQ